jgi:hypothetical protein
MALTNTKSLGMAGLSFLTVILLGAGCSRSNQNAASQVPVEQVPATIEGAFNNAPVELKRQATEAVSALKSQNDAAAFVHLQTLSGRSDLTPEQRKAAFASWMAVNARLQQSAANGNSAAQELLEKYRATK